MNRARLAGRIQLKVGIKSSRRGRLALTEVKADN